MSEGVQNFDNKEISGKPLVMTKGGGQSGSGGEGFGGSHGSSRSYPKGGKPAGLPADVRGGSAKPV